MLARRWRAAFTRVASTPAVLTLVLAARCVDVLRNDRAVLFARMRGA
jgi:hypothetical protein